MADVGTVIVTGGASGLGEAVATAVEKAGGHAVVLDRSDPGREFEAERVDLADPRAAEAAVRRVVERHDDVRGIVTAAGTDVCGAIVDVDAEDWERVVAVNLLGTAAVIRAAVPALTANAGRIVTVGSTLGFRVFPDASAYCASKFGVVGLSRALAVELAGRVGVTLLVPGGMRTRFFDERPDAYKPGPDAMLNDPADVAESALFALRQPAGVEIRELVITPAIEPSWP